MKTIHVNSPSPSCACVQTTDSHTHSSRFGIPTLKRRKGGLQSVKWWALYPCRWESQGSEFNPSPLNTKAQSLPMTCARREGGIAGHRGRPSLLRFCPQLCKLLILTAQCSGAGGTLQYLEPNYSERRSHYISSWRKGNSVSGAFHSW